MSLIGTMTVETRKPQHEPSDFEEVDWDHRVTPSTCGFDGTTRLQDERAMLSE
jgi:hypothetical protein